MLSDEVVGAGERKDDVVTNSMYAWVREAVVLRSGVRRRRVSRGGVSVMVVPSVVADGITGVDCRL